MAKKTLWNWFEEQEPATAKFLRDIREPIVEQWSDPKSSSSTMPPSHALPREQLRGVERARMRGFEYPGARQGELFQSIESALAEHIKSAMGQEALDVLAHRLPLARPTDPTELLRIKQGVQAGLAAPPLNLPGPYWGSEVETQAAAGPIDPVLTEARRATRKQRGLDPVSRAAELEAQKSPQYTAPQPTAAQPGAPAFAPPPSQYTPPATGPQLSSTSWEPTPEQQAEASAIPWYKVPRPQPGQVLDPAAMRGTLEYNQMLAGFMQFGWTQSELGAALQGERGPGLGAPAGEASAFLTQYFEQELGAMPPSGVAPQVWAREQAHKRLREVSAVEPEPGMQTWQGEEVGWPKGMVRRQGAAKLFPVSAIMEGSHLLPGKEPGTVITPVAPGKFAKRGQGLFAHEGVDIFDPQGRSMLEKAPMLAGPQSIAAEQGLMARAAIPLQQITPVGMSYIQKGFIGSVGVSKPVNIPFPETFDPQWLGERPGDVSPTVSRVSSGGMKYTEQRPDWIVSGQQDLAELTSAQLYQYADVRGLTGKGGIVTHAMHVEQRREALRTWQGEQKPTMESLVGRTFEAGEDIRLYEGGAHINLGVGRAWESATIQDIIRTKQGVTALFDVRTSPEQATLGFKSGISKSIGSVADVQAMMGGREDIDVLLEHKEALGLAYGVMMGQRPEQLREMLGLEPGAELPRWQEKGIGTELTKQFAEQIMRPREKGGWVEKIQYNIPGVHEDTLKEFYEERGLVASKTPVEGRPHHFDITTTPIETLIPPEGERVFLGTRRDYPGRGRFPLSILQALERQSPELYQEVMAGGQEVGQAYWDIISATEANIQGTTMPGAVTPTAEQAAAVVTSAREIAVAETRGAETHADLPPNVLEHHMVEAARAAWGDAPIQTPGGTLAPASAMSHFQAEGKTYAGSEATAAGTQWARGIELLAEGIEDPEAYERAIAEQNKLGMSPGMLRTATSAQLGRAGGGDIIAIEPALPPNLVQMPVEEVLRAYGLKGKEARLFEQEWLKRSEAIMAAGGEMDPGEWEGMPVLTGLNYPLQTEELLQIGLGAVHPGAVRGTIDPRTPFGISDVAAQAWGIDADGDRNARKLLGEVVPQVNAEGKVTGVELAGASLQLATPQEIRDIAGQIKESGALTLADEMGAGPTAKELRDLLRDPGGPGWHAYTAEAVQRAYAEHTGMSEEIGPAYNILEDIRERGAIAYRQSEPGTAERLEAEKQLVAADVFFRAVHGYKQRPARVPTESGQEIMDIMQGFGPQKGGVFRGRGEKPGRISKGIAGVMSGIAQGMMRATHVAPETLATLFAPEQNIEQMTEILTEVHKVGWGSKEAIQAGYSRQVHELLGTAEEFAETPGGIVALAHTRRRGLAKEAERGPVGMGEVSVQAEEQIQVQEQRRLATSKQPFEERREQFATEEEYFQARLEAMEESFPGVRPGERPVPAGAAPPSQPPPRPPVIAAAGPDPLPGEGLDPIARQWIDARAQKELGVNIEALTPEQMQSLRQREAKMREQAHAAGIYPERAAQPPSKGPGGPLQRRWDPGVVPAPPPVTGPAAPTITAPPAQVQPVGPIAAETTAPQPPEQLPGFARDIAREFDVSRAGVEELGLAQMSPAAHRKLTRAYASDAGQGDPRTFVEWMRARQGQGTPGGGATAGGGAPASAGEPGAISQGQYAADRFERFTERIFGVSAQDFTNSIKLFTANMDKWTEMAGKASEGTEEWSKDLKGATRLMQKWQHNIERGLKQGWPAVMGPEVTAAEELMDPESRTAQLLGQADLAIQQGKFAGYMGDEGEPGGPGGNWWMRPPERKGGWPGGVGGVAARGIHELTSGWELMRLQRIWNMTGGPIFQEQIPAAAGAELANWQLAQQIGGYEPGLPEGVAGGVMRYQAERQQGMIEGGRAGYRAWGGMLQTAGALREPWAVAAPAVGAGLMAGSLAASIAAPSMGGIGTAAIQVGLPIMGAVAGAGLAYAGAEYLRSYGTATTENQVALARGEVPPWMAALGQQLQEPPGQRQRWYTGTEREQRPTWQESMDWAAQQQQLGQQVLETPLGELSGQQRMQATKAIIDDLRGREGTFWEGMAEPDVAGVLSGFAGWDPRMEQVRAGEPLPESMVRDWEFAAATGITPAQFQPMAQQMRLGPEGPMELFQAAPRKGGRREWTAQMEQWGWLSPYGATLEDIGGEEEVRKVAGGDWSVERTKGMPILTGQDALMLERLQRNEPYAVSQMAAQGAPGFEPWMEFFEEGGLRAGTRGFGQTGQAARSLGMQVPSMPGALMGEGGGEVRISTGKVTIETGGQWGLQDWQLAEQRGYRDVGFERQAEAISEQYEYTHATWGIQDQTTALQRGYQQQQFAFQWESMEMQDAQFYERWGIQSQRLGQQAQWGREDMSRDLERSRTQFGWRFEDLAQRGATTSLQYAWGQEDYEESMRYATGRERRQIMKSRDRATTMYGIQMGELETEEDRTKQRQQWAEEDMAREKERFERRLGWSRQDMDLSRKHHDEQMDLSRRRHQASVKYFEDQIPLQDRARDLAREYYEFQHTQQVDALALAVSHAAVLDTIQDIQIDVDRIEQTRAARWNTLTAEGGPMAAAVSRLESATGYVRQIANIINSIRMPGAYGQTRQGDPYGADETPGAGGR